MRNLAIAMISDLCIGVGGEVSADENNRPGGDPDISAQEDITSSTSGSKPAGTAVARMTMAVTIDSIDLDNGTVTLEGPRGNTHTLTASDPKNLAGVQVGDLVDITYTETLSISVLSPQKK
jgi:hypothetical protein